jgi:NAD(P)-dependent dehydrogenase (short-subunit alcohol dehydrogenase family)
MHSLNGRTFAVTGASGNLGAAVVEVLHERGANVVLLDRGSKPIREGERLMSLDGLDLGDAAHMARALDEAAGRFGSVTGIVATVGGFDMGGTAEEDGWGVWDAMMTANLETAVAAIQAAVPRLPAPGGRIVTVGARPGVTGVKGIAAYAASKAAVLRLTESLSEELKAKGITVNSVLPSTIDTPQNRAAMPSADYSKWVPPRDIAEVIAFLVSDAARSVTGALMPVFGRG